MNKVLISFLLSTLPISEIRGGLIYAIPMKVPVLAAFIVCLTGNLIIIPLVFLFFDFFHNGFYSKIGLYRKVFDRITIKIRKKVKDIENKVGVYGYLGLTLFVAVPLPVTGAWTALFASWFLNLDRRKSSIAIALGVLIAGIIVLISVYGLTKIIGF